MRNGPPSGEADLPVGSGESRFTGSNLQVARGAWLQRGFVVTVAQAGGKYKMVAQVRDVFEKQNIVPKRNVIEEHQVLVQLPDIADMGTTGYPNFFARKLTARNSLTPASRVQSA